MKTTVIGATGIIGNHIVRELIADGHDVTAASRGQTPSLNLEGLKINRVTADLADVSSLIAVFKGSDWVFQAAAYYPKTAFGYRQHLKCAMQEIDNVLEAVRQSKIRKLVYTSSLTAIGMAKRGILATEEIAYNMSGHDPHPYFMVKHHCEERLRQAVRDEGLPIVIVNPTGCFGPYELKPKNNCLIPQLVERSLPVLVTSDMNVVDVRDVARGHILAAEKGRIGERYALGGVNVTTEMVINEICDIAGVAAPRFVLPIRLGVAACYATELLGLAIGKPPLLPVLGLRFVQYGQHFSFDKAANELGYEAGPMTPCYERAIEWYKKIGYC